MEKGKGVPTMAITNPTRDEIKAILKSAKRIAVVGLSDKPHRTSYLVSEAMKKAGYDIIPVNPNITDVFGIKAVSNLGEINGHVDIVNVFRRNEYIHDVANEFLSIDANVFWTQLGLVDQEVFTMLKEKGKTVVMDRCIKVEHSLTN